MKSFIVSLLLLIVACPAAAQDETSTTRTDDAAAVAPVPSPSSAQPQAEKPLPAHHKKGKIHFWFSQWPDFIAKFDPVADKVVGKVKLRNGLWFGTTVSHDRSQLFVITGQRRVVEIVDRKRMEVIDEHPFVKEGYIQRVSRIRECPGGTHWYVRVDRVKAEPDRYKPEDSQWLYYNVAEKKVEKTMKDMPRAIRSGARISPDGKKWHIFSSDIKIVDPKTLKEEGVIELAKPQFTGMGPMRVRGDDFFHSKNPEAYRFMYSMRDPVKNSRTTVGLVDISITDKKVMSWKEWGADPGVRRLQMDRACTVGVGQGGGFGRGSDRGTKLVLYDLENGRKIGEHYQKFRPRRGLSGISPDGSKIYVGGAGSDFMVFDRDFKHIKTVELDGEIGGRGMDTLEDL